MIVRPFRGLRPRADLAAKIPSLPYDVLDSDEARRLAEGDPHTFLHVVKPEIDLDPSVPVHDARVYAKGAENLRAMIEKGWLVRDPRPAYYVYRLVAGSHEQTGIVGAAAVEDYRAGRIKRHEHTRPEKEDDRTHHAEALGAHPGPVFLAHRGHAVLERFASGIAASRSPDADFEAAGGVRHTLWKVDDPEETARVERAFEELPATYIADGHHRAAAYARLAGIERFLAVHFPAADLRILDYNRVVRDLAGLDPSAFLARVREAGFTIREPWERKRPTEAGEFGLYLGGTWRLLVSPAAFREAADPVARLDVTILSATILRPILGIEDPRTDPRIDFVGGIRGMEGLEARVDSGAWAAALALHPTRMEDVMNVADAGGVMPPKSTWFEPKLRSGMVVHLIDEARR